MLHSGADHRQGEELARDHASGELRERQEARGGAAGERGNGDKEKKQKERGQRPAYGKL